MCLFPRTIFIAAAVPLATHTAGVYLLACATPPPTGRPRPRASMTRSLQRALMASPFPQRLQEWSAASNVPSAAWSLLSRESGATVANSAARLSVSTSR